MNQRPCVNGILAAVLIGELPSHSRRACQGRKIRERARRRETCGEEAGEAASAKQDASKPTLDDQGGAGDKQ